MHFLRAEDELRERELEQLQNRIDRPSHVRVG